MFCSQYVWLLSEDVFEKWKTIKTIKQIKAQPWNNTAFAICLTVPILITQIQYVFTKEQHYQEKPRSIIKLNSVIVAEYKPQQHPMWRKNSNNFQVILKKFQNKILNQSNY